MRALLGVALLLSIVLAACGEESPAGSRCAEAQTRACTCDAGRTGTQSCGDSGQWGSCSCRADCVLSEFGAWSACSAECGGGTQTRTRAVVKPAGEGGQSCGELTESRACNEEPCPVDCVVSDFGEWSACSAECGGGTQTRTRQVVTQPAGSGQPCGELEESRGCNEQPCLGCDDGIQNQGEAGVDCGGPCAERCPGLTPTRVDVAGRGDGVALQLGADFLVTFEFAIRVPGCATCRTQVLLTLHADDGTLLGGRCVYDDVPGSGPPVTASFVDYLGVGLTTDPAGGSLRATQLVTADCGAASAQFIELMKEELPGFEIAGLIAEAPPNGFELVHASSGKCLDLPMSSPADGVGLIAFPCTGNSNQAFTLGFADPDPALRYVRNRQLVLQHSGSCLDVDQGLPADGIPIQQRSCPAGGPEQLFTLRARDRGYVLENLATGKCVTVDGDGSALSTPIVQQTCAAPDEPAPSQVFSLSTSGFRDMELEAGFYRGTTDAVTNNSCSEAWVNALVIPGDWTLGWASATSLVLTIWPRRTTPSQILCERDAATLQCRPYGSELRFADDALITYAFSGGALLSTPVTSFRLPQTVGFACTGAGCAALQTEWNVTFPCSARYDFSYAK